MRLHQIIINCNWVPNDNPVDPIRQMLHITSIDKNVCVRLTDLHICVAFRSKRSTEVWLIRHGLSALKGGTDRGHHGGE